MAGKRATSIVFKFFFFFYLGVALLSFLSNHSDLIFDDENNVERADGFTIESYNVVLDVEENNKVDVTENVTVGWYEEGHHGIYKFTPEWLKYTSKDGRTIQRKSVVSNYRAEGEEYSLDVVKKKQRIKIGSAAYTLERGNKDYVIKYTYDMGKDPYKGFDEFIFHAFGDYWGTEIKNPSIQVNMPKSIEGYNVNFFMDKKRETNINEFMDYKVSGKTLTATFNSDKYYHKQYIEYYKNQIRLNEVNIQSNNH